ncbi:MAG TPA: hypothetical protein QF753_16425, partial [Victivallales bacterium]|nr:hypothetical protein [Victivallales bacterium]
LPPFFWLFFLPINYYFYEILRLYSTTINKFYSGISKFSEKRKRQHNKGQTYYTSKTKDWVED